MYDVAVIGSGFAGSLLAMIARRLGRSVILLEKGRHPRFAIGESTTPLSNLLLEELSARYDLPGIVPLSKWGTWQQQYPDLDGGIKRGFTFYHHRFGERAAVDRDSQLLVAASPNEATADTHWHRAEVDHHFVREAVRMGVEYLDQVELREAVEEDDAVRLRGEGIDIAARFVVDATGPRGFLHRAFGLPELPLPGFPQTQGLYTHFRGVGRTGDPPGAPYPPDDAALHHVFEGGWIWVLPFRSGITSAGVAAVDSLAESLQFREGAAAWGRLLDRLPAVREQFAGAVATRPFVHARRLAFRSGVVAGKRWALLPSAAGFVDPLLSTGFPLTLFGVSRLARMMEDHWDSAEYSRLTTNELLATARLIGALYATMHDFPRFASISMLYFAAASYSEAARRLGKTHLAGSYLLHDHPLFRPYMDDPLHADIPRAIEPFNIAGLCRADRRNWYPVDAQDLVQGAAKLEATPDEIARLLARTGFVI